MFISGEKLKNVLPIYITQTNFPVTFVTFSQPKLTHLVTFITFGVFFYAMRYMLLKPTILVIMILPLTFFTDFKKL